MLRICLPAMAVVALFTIGGSRGDAQVDALRWYQSASGFEYVYPADWSSEPSDNPGREGAFRSPARDAMVLSFMAVVDGPVDTTRYLTDQFAADRNDHPDLQALAAIETTITGADSAAVTAESYTIEGTDWGTFKIAAQRGMVLALFVIQSTTAYENAHEILFRQMVGSFRFQTAFDAVFSAAGSGGVLPLLRTSGQGDVTTETFETDDERVQFCWGADGVSAATGLGPSASFIIRPVGGSGASARFVQNTFGQHCAYAEIGAGMFQIEVTATPWTAWTVSVSGG